MGGSSSKSEKKKDRKASKRRSKRDSKMQKKIRTEEGVEEVGGTKQGSPAPSPLDPAQAPPSTTPPREGMTYQAFRRVERKMRLEEDDSKPVDVPYLTSQTVSAEALCEVCQVFTGAELTPCGVCGAAYHESCLRKVGGPPSIRSSGHTGSSRAWNCSNCREISNLLTEEEISRLLKKLENCGITKDVPVAVAACLGYVVLTYESHVGVDMTEDQVETEMAAFQRMAQPDSALVAWTDLLNYETLKVLSHRNKNSLVRLLTEPEIQRLRETFRKHDPEGKGEITAVDAKNSIQRSLMELVNAGDKKLFQEEGRGGVITWADFLRNNAIYMLAARISLPAKVLRPSIRLRAAAPSPALEERPTSFPLSPATPHTQATPPPASLAPVTERPRPSRPVSTPPTTPMLRPPPVQVPAPAPVVTRKILMKLKSSVQKVEVLNEGRDVGESGEGNRSGESNPDTLQLTPATTAVQIPLRSDRTVGSGENLGKRDVIGSVTNQNAKRHETRHSVGCAGVVAETYMSAISECNTRLIQHRRSGDWALRSKEKYRAGPRWSDSHLFSSGEHVREMKERFKRLSDGPGDTTPIFSRLDPRRESTPQRRRSEDKEEVAETKYDVGKRETTPAKSMETGNDENKGIVRKQKPLKVSRSLDLCLANDSSDSAEPDDLRRPCHQREANGHLVRSIKERLSDGHGGSLRVDFLRDLTTEMIKMPISGPLRQRHRGDRNSDGSDKSQRDSGEASRYDAVRIQGATTPTKDSDFLISDGHVFFSESPAVSPTRSGQGVYNYAAHAPTDSPALPVSVPHIYSKPSPPTNGSPHGQRAPLRSITPGRSAHALRAHTRSMLLSGVKLSSPEVAHKPPQGHGKRPISMAI